MTANAGYATLQIIPSVQGIAAEIRRQLAPAADEGERSGQETGSNFGESFKSVLEAAGVLTAVEKITEGLTEAFAGAIEQSGMPGELQAQLGVTAAVAERYGDIAGKLYAGAVTDSVESGAEDIKAIVASGLVPAGATNAQLQSIATKVSDVSTAFGQDLGPTAVAAGQLIRNGMAKDAASALDLVTVGLRGTDERGADLLETFGEYSPVFKTLGLSGATAMGLIRQGLAGGAKDTDNIGDAIKEFSLVVTGGGDSVDDAFKAAGLSSKKLTADVAAGGPRASKALGTVLNALREMPKSAARAQVIQTLFGGPGEDLGASIFSLNVGTAAKSLGKLSGSADNTGKALRDNAGARLTQFSRSLRQGLVQVIGGQVLPRLLVLGTVVSTKVGPPLTKLGGVLSRDVGPAMDATGHFITGTLVPGLISAAGWVNRNSTALEIAGGVIGTILLPLLITLAVGWVQSGVAAVGSAASQVVAWVSTGTSAVASAGAQVIASYRTVGGWIASGAAAVAGGARVVAGWVLSGAAATAGAAGSVIAAAEVVAGWVVMGVQSLFRAAQMAAAWLIALGPIGWITIAVVAIVALIIANWSKVSSWTVKIWHGIVGWITAAGASVLGWFRANWPLLLEILTGPLGLAVWAIRRYWAQISGAFTTAYHAVVNTGKSLVGWVAALPGRVAGALASLGSRIYSAAVTGFGRLVSAASTEASKMLTLVQGLPGRIKAGLGSLGGLLSSAGHDIVTGLWAGISSMGGYLSSKISGFVKDNIPGPVRKVLDMHSPSKVMAALGRFAAQGLVVGLTGSASQVAAASKRVADYVRQAFSEATAAQIASDRRALARLGKGKADRVRAAALRADIASQQRIARAGTGLARIVAADNARLAVLARQRDSVAARLKAAQGRLTDLQKSWSDLRGQIASGITGALGITREMDEGVPVTAASILDRLKGDVHAAQLFAKELATLRARGVSAGLLDQIASAGIDQGGATAAALIAATPQQLAAINSQQKALTDAANKAGAVAADAMYASGIRAAQGLVDGLAKQESAIERQMLAIAKAMQAAIRKALGIHSPSRVMARLGAFVGRGLVVGVDGERGRVDAAMRRLVAVPPAPVIGARGTAAGAGRGAATVTVNYNAPVPEDPYKAAMELGRRTLAAVAV